MPNLNLDSRYSNFQHMCSYQYDLSVEEAAELARRAIYHATFRDGASGGVASGISWLLLSFSSWYAYCVLISGLQAYIYLKLVLCSVYHVGPNGWKKLSGDDVGELHYKYYPVVHDTVEQEMIEVTV